MAGPNDELVVDTSVVVKFFFAEPGSHHADRLLEQFLSGATRLVALDFLFIEFVNVTWLRVRQGKCSLEEARRHITRLLRLSSDMEIVPARTLMPDTLDASCKYDHPAYDSALAALASRRAIPLLTADRELFRKVKPSLPAAQLLR